MSEDEAGRAVAKKSGAKPRSKQKTTPKKVVVVSELRLDTSNSDSVKELQRRLKVNASGNYDKTTQAAVRRWQNENGFTGGRGLRVSREQAEALFGTAFKLQSE